MDKNFGLYCSFCGASIGEISERTGKKVISIYDCRKCKTNYCNECSKKSKTKGERELVQICLRCGDRIIKISD